MAESADKTRRLLAGVAFMEGVGQMYNVISATNSSPQTTEVYGNGPRLASLMKWNKIGYVQGLGFMAIGSWISRSLWPLVGGVMVVGVMHGCYTYAKRCALQGTDGGPAAGLASEASRGAGQRFVQDQGGQTTGGNPEPLANTRVR